MSSLIEQAAQRLEQLRQAGIEIPEIENRPSPFAPPATMRSAEVQPILHAPAHAPLAVPRANLGHADNASGEMFAKSRRVELDLSAIASAGIVTPNAPRSHMADQYRVIKRPLIANAMGRGAATVTHGNLIMVTSALPGEGKSFTSINLAMSIAAELDHTVMRLDPVVGKHVGV